MVNRATQTQAEVFVVPDTQKARVSQTQAEVFVVPDTQKARVTQTYLEVFVVAAADTQAPAGNAAGTGAAANPSASVAPTAGSAAGSGQANDATVSTASSTDAAAELASGTGAANGPSAVVAPTAGGAAGSGQANNATISTAGGSDVSVNAGHAAGTGQAFDGFVDDDRAVFPPTAVGSGVAFNATTSGIFVPPEPPPPPPPPTGQGTYIGPQYHGESRGIHVEGDATDVSLVPVGPVYDVPTYKGRSAAIMVRADSPPLNSQLITGPLYDRPQYHGRSTAIHVRGPVVPWVPPGPVPSCDCCNEDSVAAASFEDDFDRTVPINGWGTSTSGTNWSALGPGSGDRKVDGGYGKIIHDAAASGQTSTKIDWTSNNFILTGQFRTEQLGAGTGDRYTEIGLRKAGSGSSINEGLGIAYWDTVIGGPGLFFDVDDSPAFYLARTWLAGQDYLFRWERAGTSNRVRVWQFGLDEPTTWDLEVNAALITPDRFAIFKQGGDNVNPEQIWFKHLALETAANAIGDCGAGSECAYTDDFERFVAGNFGTSTVGIPWVQYSGDYVTPGPSAGIAYEVDGTGGIITVLNVNTQAGSMDLPLPFTEFMAKFLISNYTIGEQLGFVNFSTPGGSSSDYIALRGDDQLLSPAGTLSGADFTFDGRPFYVKALVSAETFAAKIWYAGEAEPSAWMVSGPSNSADPRAISFELDTIQVNGGKMKISELEVSTAAPDALALCPYEDWETLDPTWFVTFGQAADLTLGGGMASFADVSPSSLVLQQTVLDDYPDFYSLKGVLTYRFLFRMSEPPSQNLNSNMSVAFIVSWFSNISGSGSRECSFGVGWNPGSLAGPGYYSSAIQLRWGGMNVGPNAISQGPSEFVPTDMFADGNWHEGVLTIDPVSGVSTLSCDGMSVSTTDAAPPAPLPPTSPADATDYHRFAVTFSNRSGHNGFGGHLRQIDVGVIEFEGVTLPTWCTVEGEVHGCGSGDCAACEDPGTGQTVLPFSPNYLPIFRRQIGDPTTNLDSYICTLESGAMALDWETRGAVQVWGGELIPWTGRTEASIAASGTNLGNVRQAWLHWGKSLSVRSGQSWTQLMQCLAQGRGVILQGDYDQFSRAEKCQVGFERDHAIFLLPFMVGSKILTGDPLCSTYHGREESSLRAYAEKLGRKVYGTTAPQKILFAVTSPWIP